jgi:hypothetical protein
MSGRPILRETIVALTTTCGIGANQAYSDMHQEGGQHRHACFLRLANHHGVLCPVHQLRQRHAVMEIGGNLLGDKLLGDDCLVMTMIRTLRRGH